MWGVDKPVREHLQPVLEHQLQQTLTLSSAYFLLRLVFCSSSQHLHSMTKKEATSMFKCSLNAALPTFFSQRCSSHGSSVKDGSEAPGTSTAAPPILSRALSKGKRFRWKCDILIFLALFCHSLCKQTKGGLVRNVVYGLRTQGGMNKWID